MRIDYLNNTIQSYNEANVTTGKQTIPNNSSVAFTDSIVTNTPSFSVWHSGQQRKLFQDTSQQTYMNLPYPQLFACNDATSYYRQMCLTMPQLFGDGIIDIPGGSTDYSVTGPDGTAIYNKPNDGGTHDKIAVIDAFNSSNPEVCMAIDSTTDTTMAHGEFVASLIESQLKEQGLNYSVDRLNVEIVDGVLQGGIEQMDHVLQNKGDYRAVNVSLCEYCDYDTVSKAVGKSINATNLAENKELIMSTVMSSEVTEFYNEYKDVLNQGYLPDFSQDVADGTITQTDADQIESLLTLRYKVESLGEFYAKADQLVQSGVPVFMAAGNYEDMFNFGALLTSYVEYVGSEHDTYTNPYTNSSGGFSDNSLVSRVGQESYSGNKVVNGKIDIDSNGSGDIDATGIDTSTVFATGTSFASPWALVQALAKADNGSSSTATASAEITKNKSNTEIANDGSLYYTARTYTAKSLQVGLPEKAMETNTAGEHISAGRKIIKDSENSNYQQLRERYAQILGADLLETGYNYYNNGPGSYQRIYFHNDLIEETYNNKTKTKAETKSES